ncbi:hypothetical protein [Cohnella thailandensis]|uniref:Uncharacterized protein n=1 Tax=Cohnella thailandensis TaxID=557557 RepID=A0A841T4X4_9BACL|nr:hypothetical protein [Cohnella thailandensis]MBB6637378.1 hypothetical protein [Cohnella thailandensis]MBP1976707.1 hypothetical protein [Cohnella thailandensis]
MSWEQQWEQIERQMADKAKAEPAFAELVKTDFEEAVRQVSGFSIPLAQWEAAAVNPSDTGELSEDDLELVVGGTQSVSGVGSIDLSSMDLESALMMVQSQRAQMLEDALRNQMSNTTGDSQMDLLRLQSLTNKRNEAFDVMTNFIKKMQDSRNSILGNMR